MILDPSWRWPPVCSKCFAAKGGLPARYYICNCRNCMCIADPWEFLFGAYHFIRTNCVFYRTSTVVFMLFYFFPQYVAEFYSLQPIFYFINQASARCNLTITASRKSPCEDPIMEMNQSPIPLLPTPPTHCSYRHHLSLKTESVET